MKKIIMFTMAAALVSVQAAAHESEANRAHPSSPLNILVTNDDGTESSTVNALYQRLTAAGHHVIISSEVCDNSGKGGALDFLRPIGPLPATNCGAKPSRGGVLSAGAPGVGTLPGMPYAYYVNSTPVAATLFGIDIASKQVFRQAPDLVISGPNYGNNTGLIDNNSGTVNAALIAINRGIPAIAVSAEQPQTYKPFNQLAAGDPEYEVADVVVRLVKELQQRKEVAGDALLPRGIGLNVNLPKFAKGTAATLPVKFSKIGLATVALPYFVEDLSTDPLAKSYLAQAFPNGVPAYPGVTLVLNQGPVPAGLKYVPDTNPDSEQNVVNSGAIAISVMQGTPQAPRAQEAIMRAKLINFAR
ncbi:5'/3'-nucleotidase SurE [Collimonas antrihumi]|uniref:5'/3'-nucleotidase SurE n=1 Tax=Collimonas antrihumi TaxID=1940615 RepID=UPI001B8B135F|nr:5'/3'-nucleotidase SurE [Collimonas antrihumi]